MIRKLIFLLVLIFSGQYVLSAQEDDGRRIILDTARYVVKYELAFVPDSVKGKPIIKYETNLEVGERISRCNIKNSEISELNYLKWSNWDREPQFRFPNYEPGIDNVYIGYPRKDKMTVTMNLECAGGLKYEENVPKLDWVLSDETRTVGGHQCRKAECDFRGRSYEVWYAPDIPISLGPWKLGGLPGLIMEESDSTKQFVLSFKGIESVADTVVPISMLTRNYRKMSRKKCSSYRARMFRTPATFYNALGVVPSTMRIIAPKGGYPYNPIEKEED